MLGENDQESIKLDFKAVCHSQSQNFNVSTYKHWLNTGDGFLDWQKSQTTSTEKNFS